MKDKHIIDLLESTPFGSISEPDLETIKTHAAECDPCEKAFAAARVAGLLLREGQAETFEPSPFFQTRVLAHLRERKATAETWSWRGIWQATGALASSMVATVAALAFLTFFIPAAPTTSELLEATTASNAYSAEEVILNANEDEQSSDAFVLTTLYDAVEDSAK